MTTAPATRLSGSLPAPAALPPAQLTTFIGREKEIAAVCELLRSVRLLTLTGVGGAGKTRLAGEIAARTAPLYEVVGWVDLAPVADPALVGPVVAGALGFREEGGRPALDIMLDRICRRTSLIVLDNCEHLVDACAALAETLLKTCSRVRILATSREALGVSGEQAWLVPPLTLPGDHADTTAVAATESGRLFLERARAVLPAFELNDGNAPAVAQICRRLDGIPLAIELAAARVRVLAPGQIAARLDDAFKLLTASGRPAVPRHRALKETIDWSHALLGDAEAALFRRLSVFAGSFSLDAVEAICPDPPVAPEAVLDLLAALVDKSLVLLETADGEARYRLLETLRQYGHDRLVLAGEEAAFRQRHVRFFTDLVVAREHDTFGGGMDPVWRRRLVAEEGNLRAALDRAEDPETVLLLCSALHWHWFARGQFREARRRLSDALDRAEGVPPLVLGKAHVAAAAVAYWLGEHERIAPNAARAVELLRGQDDPWHLTNALATLGLATRDPVASDTLLAEATSLARTLGSRIGPLLFALYWRGRMALHRGQTDLAEQLLTEAHALGVGRGSPPGTAHPLTMLGQVALVRGALDRAVVQLRDALRIHSDNGDAIGCLWTLEGLAFLSHRVGDHERAAMLLAGIAGERSRIGAAWLPAEQRKFEALATEIRAQLGAERFESNSSRGEAMEVADLIAQAVPPAPTAAPAAAPVAVIAPAVPGAVSTLGVRTLGPLGIQVNGAPLDRDAWSSVRSRELLLFLLCHPEGRTREQVGVAFWPEASPEQVRNNFHVTLHRLRKTLGGSQWVTLVDERYGLSPDVQVDFDARRFERDVAAGLCQLRRGGDAGALEAALALYQGDFLEHENAGDWHQELRDRLRLRYLEALTALAESRQKQERWADAAEVWRQVVARDELDERAHRGLMTCYARLGERSQIQQLYQRLERALKRELEAEPNAETTQLYRSLLARQ